MEWNSINAMNDEISIRNWNYLHAGFMVIALLVSVFVNEIFVFLSAGLISFSLYIIFHIPYIEKIKPFGGYANWVTFLRNILTFFLGFSFFILSDIQIVILALIIISLDGADGYLARKFKTQSTFGAYFDMETDAFFVALMSLILYKRDYADYWILIPGFLRYFYVLFLLLIGFHRRKEKRMKFTQVIAVVFFISLLSPFLLPYSVYFPCLVGASILIIISFAYSFYSILIPWKDEN
jgi:phosphatidylglycerophosphate synthase